MAVTFPRDLIEIDSRLPLRQLSFRPMYTQVRGLSRGARPHVANIAPDLWVAEFVTHILTYDQALEQEAWLQSLDGGARLFKMWHTLCRYPRNYPNGIAGMTRAGGGAFDGTCNLQAIGTQRDTVTLNTLPAGFVFKVSDMLSFPIASPSSQSLHRVIEAGTADGSGAVTLSVRPTLVLPATTNVTVDLIKPWCLGVVDSESINCTYSGDQFATVSFSAMQTY